MDGMKVAYLSTEYPPKIYGGLGVYVDSISRALATLGDLITVFAPGDETLKKRQSRRKVTAIRERPIPMKDGLEIFLSPETIGWGEEGLDLLLDLLSFNQLAASDLLGKEPFDLCVAHDWLTLPAGMAAKRSGLPLIYHVHGLEVGRSAHPNHQLVDLEKRGAHLADAVMTVSYAMKEQLVELGVPAEKIHVCYHGVDTDLFSPEAVDSMRTEEIRKRLGIDEGDLVILFLGRLEPVKGVIQLLQAMPSVLDRNPRARLLMVGKGTLEEEVRREASRLPVTLVTDFLEEKDKVQYYGLADVCVFPSLYEPFGIVALEAAAMGKAAVVGASGVSGLAEIVNNPATEKPTGVHVDSSSPEDIAWGLNLALADPLRLAEWGRNARERSLNLFTWPRAAELTQEIYREVVGSQS